MLDLDALLVAAMPYKPSDLHLRPGRAPIIRSRGRLRALDEWPVLTEADLEGLSRRLLADDQWARLRETGGAHVPQALSGVGRFRITIYRARGVLRIAVRVLAREIPVLDELNLPPVVRKLSMERRGLILITGASGSGKSTTLAAMLNLMNLHRNDHIVTIEDPIEYVFESGQCLITQREIGVDVPTWEAALRLVLRQDPNVVVVGEMRDVDTFRAVLSLAQTGHLVLATLHSGSAVETVNRIISVFPDHRDGAVRGQLAHVLKGVISLRLVERADGTGLIPVSEVLTSTSSIVRAILDQTRTARIPSILSRGRDLFGMQTFDQCALDYFLQGTITEAAAKRACSSPVDFEVQLQRLRKERRIEESAHEPRGGRAQMEAIVVLEVVGMTDLLISHGDQVFKTFVDRIEARLSGIARKYRSRVLERHLDGFLLTFPNVDWAMLGLRDLLNHLSEFNELSEMEVAFRGSLHYGRTWADPNSNRVGAAVHKAFRVCAAIDTPDLYKGRRPKEKNVVVATEEAREVLIPYNVASHPLGGVPLKGFGGTHELFELEL